MTDAPETIWASPETNGPCAGWDFEGSWHVDQTCGEVKYTRSDIAPKVKPLEWAKSNITPWDGDYHTVPTRYSIRGAGNEDYRLIFPGGFNDCNSPEAAKAAAQAHHDALILSALETQGEG